MPAIKNIIPQKAVLRRGVVLPIIAEILHTALLLTQVRLFSSSQANRSFSASVGEESVNDGNPPGGGKAG
ncbi:MAG TPA: hypothetical protein VGQ81_16060 [Acidobacteriota bacterium]|jgi:hypothetical protein|nr:hypothetical protein [Acidobacteriota bacterium]